MKAGFENDAYYFGSRKSSGLNSVSEFDERFKHFENRNEKIESAMSPKKQEQIKNLSAEL